MSKNIRYIIITLLICAAAAFSVNQITSTAAHDAQVNAQANGYAPGYPAGQTTLIPGYWLVCSPGAKPSVMHVTQLQDEYTDPGSGITLIYMGASQPTAAQQKETCP